MVSVYPLMKLMSAPDTTTGTVLFDFNSDDGANPRQSCRVQNDGLSTAAPELQGDVDSIFPQYGPRAVTFTVQVCGSKSYALGKVSAAAKYLVRDRMWLMFQLDATKKPVWFRLYRPQPGELTFDYVTKTSTPDVWLWQLSLPAESFAYGARVTSSNIVINNDVANGSNPCFAQLPTITGDAPTAARVRIAHSTTQDGRQHMISVTNAPSTFTAPIAWQAGTSDGWTAGTDVGAATSDAAYSNGSYRACTFATVATMATRLSGAAPSAIAAGRYKPLVRFARSDTSSTFQVQFGVKGGFTYKYNDPINLTWPTSTSAGHAAWIDMGEVRLPQGNPLLDLSQETVTVTPDISIQAARLSGSGNLIIDAILFIPIESDYARTTFIDWSSVSPSSGILQHEYIDGEIEAVYSRFSTTIGLSTLELPAVYGAFPVLVPGDNNVIHVLEQTSPTRSKANFVGTADCPDQLATVKTLVLSYQPKFLYIGDGS